MANLSLSQLREAQKANPPYVEEDGRVLYPVDGLLLATLPPGKFVQPIFFKRSSPAKVTGGSPAEGSLPLQASPPAPPVTLAGAPLLERAWAAGKGYCRIFPACFSTAADLPDSWKAENWSAPSPWCSVEGQPNHPEFEANLAAVEAQDVKK